MKGAPARTRGIVLHAIKLGDTSKIVGVLSEEFGRVKLVVKGARQLRGRWASLLEPGNELDLLLHPRDGRDLWFLSDASLRRSALSAGAGLDKLSHLFAVLELAQRLLPEQEPVPEIWEIYERFAETWRATTDDRLASLYFALELELADALGIGLSPEHCTHCGREFGPEERAAYSASDGALSCVDCFEGAARWLIGPTLAILQRLRAVGVDDSLPALSDEQRRTLGRLLHDHLAYHLPSYRVPRSLYWLHALGDESKDAGT